MKIKDRFSEKDEQEFLEQQQSTNSRYIRRVFLIFIFLYAFFALSDYYYYPDALTALFIIRFAIVIPAFVLTIIASFNKHLFRFHQYIVALNFFIGGAGIAFMLILHPDNMVYYGGLFMVYFSGYLVIRLRYIYAVSAGIAILLFHLIFHSILIGEFTETFLFGMLFFMGANIIGIVGAYHYEQQARTHFINDILEKKAVEKELNMSLNDLVRTQKIAKIGTWRLDIKTNQVVWSEELYKMYGFDPALPVPPYTEHMKLFTPESWKMLSEALEMTSTLGTPYELELEMITAEGKNRFMFVSVEVVRDSNGDISGIRGVAQDISIRMNEKRALERSEKRFRETVLNIDAGVVFHAPDSSIIDCNNRASELLGLSKEQLLGKLSIDSNWQFVNEDGASTPFEQYPVNLVLKDKKPFKNRIYGISNDEHDNIVWVNTNGTLITNDAGITTEILITFTDITELKNSNDSLSKSERQYRLLTTQMQSGLALHEVILDNENNPVDFRFINVNDKWERVMGLKREDVIGKCVMTLFPNTEKYWIELYGRVATTGEPNHFENYAKELGKHLRSSVYSPDKGYFAVVVDDITSEINLEQEKEFLRTHDALTGLTNRQYFDQMTLKVDLIECLPVSVINFDINGLRIINEAFGYEYGNQLLIHVSNILTDCFKKEDIISRVGGDQFAVILKNTSKEAAEMIAKQVVKKVFNFKIKDTQLSISYGVASKVNNEDINQLFLISENAMYSNKIFESESSSNQSIQSLMTAYHEKNPREAEHSKRVSTLCEKFGYAVNMGDEDINKLKAISYLHDIGKIAIDDSIINKPGKLSDDEWEVIKKHPEIGARIISASDDYAIIAEDILAHHERYDGKGYPFGIAGKDIPIRARMIAIVDSYDAMSSDRPYRKALSHDEIIKELCRCAGTQFDPELIDIFIEKIISVDHL